MIPLPWRRQFQSAMVASAVLTSGIAAGSLGSMRESLEFVYHRCHLMLRFPWIYAIGAGIASLCWRVSLVYDTPTDRWRAVAKDIARSIGFWAGFAVGEVAMHGQLGQRGKDHHPSPYPEVWCQAVCVTAGLVGASLPTIATWTHAWATKQRGREEQNLSSSSVA